MKEPKHLIIWCLLFIPLLLTSCGSKIIRRKINFIQNHHNHIKSNDTRSRITVWIHGTKFSKHHLFQTYFKNKPGLVQLTQIPSSAPDYVVAQTIAEHAPEQFPFNSFYVFCWSGSLCAQTRIEASHILCDQLLDIVTQHKKKHGKSPLVQLVTHSHGGNVALNLPNVIQEKLNHSDHKIDLTIDSLILLACPVQANTASGAKDPLFKRVYALYSSLDFVQILAPQLVHTYELPGKTKREIKLFPFSERKFEDHEKISHIKIKINGRALLHNEFIGTRFLSALGTIIQELEEWHEESQPYKKDTLMCVYVHPHSSANIVS